MDKQENKKKTLDVYFKQQTTKIWIDDLGIIQGRIEWFQEHRFIMMIVIIYW